MDVIGAKASFHDQENTRFLEGNYLSFVVLVMIHVINIKDPLKILVISSNCVLNFGHFQRSERKSRKSAIRGDKRPY
jgi:hypothetical protein